MLNLRQQRFVKEYLIDLNGEKAAIRAGYSSRTARVQASQLLTRLNIREAVAEGQRQIADQLGINAQLVLSNLRSLAVQDPVALFNEDGNLRPMNEWLENERRAVVGLEFEEVFEGRGEDRAHIGTMRKLKFADKLRALELLGKHLKLFTEKSEVSGPDGEPLELAIRMVKRED